MSVTIEYTNVAMKIPSEIFVSLERTNTLTARGEYWLAASWIATSVVATTTPRNASMPVATTDVSVSAVPVSPTRKRLPPTLKLAASSSATVTSAATRAATPKVVGTGQSE